MQLSDVSDMAHELFDKYAMATAMYAPGVFGKQRRYLFRDDARFYEMQWSRAKRRLGACHYDIPAIKVSKPLAELNSLDTMRDVVLHEIAHAQVGPGHGHGEVWRRAARSLGALDRACQPATLPEAPWRLVCDCGGLNHPRYRRTKMQGRYALCCGKQPYYIKT